MVSSYLEHHGIKGQRWGVRRYQNSDGSLTESGVKRYSNQYKKEMSKYQRDASKTDYRIQREAYNKTADEYNNGKIAEFNRTHDSKSSTYVYDYRKQFSRDYLNNYNSMKLSEMKSNKHYKKAEKLAKKYSLVEFSELAKSNKYFVDTLEKTINR